MKNRTRYEQMPESIHKTYSPKDARWAIGGFTFFLHAIYCFLLFPELQRFLRSHRDFGRNQHQSVPVGTGRDLHRLAHTGRDRHRPAQ